VENFAKGKKKDRTYILSDTIITTNLKTLTNQNELKQTLKTHNKQGRH
jgi:hypothetical protein